MFTQGDTEPSFHRFPIDPRRVLIAVLDPSVNQMSPLTIGVLGPLVRSCLAGIVTQDQLHNVDPHIKNGI